MGIKTPLLYIQVKERIVKLLTVSNPLVVSINVVLICWLMICPRESREPWHRKSRTIMYIKYTTTSHIIDDMAFSLLRSLIALFSFRLLGGLGGASSWSLLCISDSTMTKKKLFWKSNKKFINVVSL